MKRVQEVPEEKASSEVKSLYENLKKSIGRIPNIFLTMGNSYAVLQAFVKLSECADQTSLSKDLREEIALVVAQANACHYCLSAHSLIAKSVGLHENDILNARKGESSHPKHRAILHFVKKCVDSQGNVSDKDVEDLKKQSVSDKEITEITLVLTLNMFTNYFNKITDPEIDFPAAPTL